MAGKTFMNLALAGSLLAVAACSTGDDAARIVGQLESDRVEITAEVTEPILARPVVEGEKVAAGTVLFRQDTARIEARLAEASATVQQSRARLDELIRGPREELIQAARANLQGGSDELAFREADLDRAEKVYERNLASTELRDRARAARDNARANVERLKAELEQLLTGTTVEELRQAEAALDQAEARVASLSVDLERHTTVAPVDAVVDSLLFEVGERPAVGQPLAILLPGTQPYARVFVPEAMRVHVGPGTGARVHVDGLDEVLDGRVRWVASESTFTPYFALTERDRGRLSFAAKVDLVGAGARLPDGVPVEVELLISNGRAAP